VAYKNIYAYGRNVLNASHTSGRLVFWLLDWLTNWPIMCSNAWMPAWIMDWPGLSCPS